MGSSTPLSPSAIAPDTLIHSVGTAEFPVVFAVRRRAVSDADECVLPTAMWRDHGAARDWGGALDPAKR